MTDTPHTVGSLKAVLADLPDGLPVILSSDEEGNGFNPLYEAVTSKYIEEDGEGHPVHPDDVDDYDSEELTDAVVLWP